MANEQKKAQSRASTVLIVDDDATRREMASVLANSGFDVQQAANASEAEDRLAATSPGIVIIAAGLPDLDGFELCRRLRKEHGSELYLILRTTKEQLFSRALNLDEGADDFLIDPLSDSEILARVETGRKMKQLQEKLAETSKSLEMLEVTDPLTGAFNRRRTDAEIQREMDRARRYARPVSLVILDIDGFRMLNDKLGRAAGNRVLEEIARILRLSTRTSDTVGRYGGEEFALVLPETSKEQALVAAEKIRTIIAQTTIAAADRQIHVTVSAGIATLEAGNYPAIGDFARAAEAALAQAKAAGRNRCYAE
jgi:two-component system cell cycle response regulator